MSFYEHISIFERSEKNIDFTSIFFCRYVLTHSIYALRVRYIAYAIRYILLRKMRNGTCGSHYNQLFFSHCRKAIYRILSVTRNISNVSFYEHISIFEQSEKNIDFTSIFFCRYVLVHSMYALRTRYTLYAIRYILLRKMS